MLFDLFGDGGEEEEEDGLGCCQGLAPKLDGAGVCLDDFRYPMRLQWWFAWSEGWYAGLMEELIAQ